MKNKIIKFSANWFGLGEMNDMPGTMGTLGAIPLFIIMNLFRNISFFKANPNFYNSFYFMCIVVFFFYSIYVSDIAEREIYKKKDPQEVVIDEVLGFMITMFLINPKGFWQNIFAIILGFILFRFFDISKPGIINKVQDLENGVGVVADDVLAGVISNFILSLIMTLVF